LDVPIGNVGAGLGATTANFKGGLGTASDSIDGLTVGALVAVNAVGSVTIDAGPHFWAAPLEKNGEFGARGWPACFDTQGHSLPLKGGIGENTTPAIIATDAVLTKAQAHRLAVMAQTGLARSIYPVHTPLDGDVVFAAATGRKRLADPAFALTRLGAVAANVLARAVARAVYEAKALPFPGAQPAWRDRFGA
jgi:D-aminopeptidase